MNDIVENYEQIQMQLMDTSTFVYKSHNLIESGYNLNLNQQRLLYLGTKKLKPRYIQSNIKPSELKTLFAHESFKDLKIYVNEFRDEFGLSSNNLYKVLADTASSLFEEKIQYLKDDGSFVEKRWVITSEYNKKEKFVKLTFHPDLILDLLVFKGRYGKMKYEATKTFSSSYSFRLYELLQNSSYKGIRTFDLEDLRYKIGIYEDTKYKNYSDFNRRVLTPAIENINKTTDINIQYEALRRGRNVGAIKFIINKNNNTNLSVDIYDDTIDLSQVENMRQIVGEKLTAGQVQVITDLILGAIKEHKEDMSFYDYLKEKVMAVYQYSQNHTIKSYLGILRTAIKGNWKINEEISKPNNFNNFEPRKYNYDALENKLLGWDEGDEDVSIYELQ